MFPPQGLCTCYSLCLECSFARDLQGLRTPCNQRACMLSHFSCVRLFVTPWIIACEAPLSMGFSRQEYYSGLSCPPPGDLPDTGIEPVYLMSPALAGGFFTTGATWEAHSLSLSGIISLHR